MKQLPILADEELEEEEHQQALRKPVQRIELSAKKARFLRRAWGVILNSVLQTTEKDLALSKST